MNRKFYAAESLVINASAKKLHSIVADYRVGHNAILPRPEFSDLIIEKGGVGAGTELVVKTTLYGKEYIYHQIVSEPEPGRVIRETDKNTGQYTTFTFEPVSDTQTCVTIFSEFPQNPGLQGWLEKLMQPGIARALYKRELQNLAEYAAK